MARRKPDPAQSYRKPGAPKAPPPAAEGIPPEVIAMIEGGKAPRGLVDQSTGRQGDKATRERKAVHRQDGRLLKKQTVYLPEDTYRRLAMYRAQTDRNFSEALTDALELLLKASGL